MNDVDLKVLVPDMDYPAVRQALRAAFPQRAREHVPENPLIVAVEIDGVLEIPQLWTEYQQLVERVKQLHKSV